MASNEKDPAKSTKEQASQTYKSLEGRSTTDHAKDGSEFSYLSPLANPPEPITDSTGPDQTAPKTAAETAQSGSCERDDDGQSQCQSQSLENRVGEEGRGSHLQDHQCLIGEEHTLHQSKQEEGGQHRGRTPIQSEGSLDDDLAYLRSASQTTDNVHRSVDGSVFNSSLSSNQSAITLCDTCSAADRSLLRSASKEFWRGMESTRLKCCERLWSHFHMKLKETFPEDPALNQRRVVHIMKALLEVNDPLDTVTISKYLRLVKFMGPFRSEENRCVVLKQLEDLVSNSNVIDPKNKKKKLCWFAGPMTRTETETKLEGKPPGTFLIRMSCTEEEEGNFALSLMMADSTIEHFRLEGHHQDAVGSNPFSLCVTFRSRTYSSLPELVNEYLRVEEIAAVDCDNATVCVFICPDLPFNQIINGYTK